MPVAVEGIYGVLAEFETPSDLVRAAQAAYRDGWRRMDCYTPYPVEEAAEAIGFHRDKVSLITLVGGLMGLCAMFSLETWISVLGVSLEYRRKADVFVAGIHHPRVRMDDFVCRTLGMFRDAGYEWAAQPLPSALQCAELPQWGDRRQFFLCLESTDRSLK